MASYRGMTMTIAADGEQVSLTADDGAAGAGGAAAEIAASLLIPLAAVSETLAGSSLLLYAATPGAFVDLAADLCYALRLDPASLVVDDHLGAPHDGPRSGLTALDGTSAINRAIGVLIERGATPESARDELHRLAGTDGGDPVHAAEQVLSSVSGGRSGDGRSGDGRSGDGCSGDGRSGDGRSRDGG